MFSLAAHVLLLLLVCAADVLGGVYPNYHANFNFVPLSNGAQYNADRVAELSWWQTGSFYQIYPRSFRDSNGDGVGDLNGITGYLDVLPEMGITGAWLSPIFKSPMADTGYDIANYTEIDPIFGTMADFRALIAKAKKLNLKILLDFVPNHTSNESLWFKLSANRDPTYKDYYVWHPGKMVNGVRQPPTNWISVFHGPAWTWHEVRQEYYLHQFGTFQPDLNYRNPKVREAMKQVLLFWLSEGVSGFRIDAVKHVFEIAPDAQGKWPDEPRNNNANDPNDYGYLEHIYTVDQPETMNLLYEWRAVLDKRRRENGDEEYILMAETSSPLDITMKYYGNETAEGAQIPFNFLIIEELSNSSNAYNYVDTLNKWLTHMPAGRTPNWVLGNHDQRRVGSRYGTDRINMFNMLLMTLPGVSVTYQGEEIGMTDVWISWNDTVDPSACNTNPDVYNLVSRDPARTPYQWNASKDAGFSTANKTWLPIADNYVQVNRYQEEQTALSHLKIFKDLISLRKENTFRLGSVSLQALGNDVLAVKRSLMNEHTYLTLMNIYDGSIRIDVSLFFTDLPYQMEYVLITDKSTAKIGDNVNIKELHLLPKEAVILRTVTKLLSSDDYYGYYTSGVARSTNLLLCYLMVYQLFACLFY